jgi:hypothetical protein
MLLFDVLRENKRQERVKKIKTVPMLQLDGLISRVTDIKK